MLNSTSVMTRSLLLCVWLVVASVVPTVAAGGEVHRDMILKEDSLTLRIHELQVSQCPGSELYKREGRVDASGPEEFRTAITFYESAASGDRLRFAGALRKDGTHEALLKGIDSDDKLRSTVRNIVKARCELQVSHKNVHILLVSQDVIFTTKDGGVPQTLYIPLVIVCEPAGCRVTSKSNYEAVSSLLAAAKQSVSMGSSASRAGGLVLGGVFRLMDGDPTLDLPASISMAVSPSGGQATHVKQVKISGVGSESVGSIRLQFNLGSLPKNVDFSSLASNRPGALIGSVLDNDDAHRRRDSAALTALVLPEVSKNVVQLIRLRCGGDGNCTAEDFLDGNVSARLRFFVQTASYP